MIGPVMLDLMGATLTDDEINLLTHPYVGGVILFSRNIQTPEQVAALTVSIRDIRSDILLAVDQEGGRVQRLKEGFTRLPPMRVFGKLYDTSPDEASQLAEMCGWLMATEVLSVGIDFSFAPVLDLDYEVSQVIGNRAFHQDPHIAAELAQLFIYGMAEAGMQATIKHFPGHGAVEADSHIDVPIDHRTLSEIEKKDIYPFKKLIAAGAQAVMPAHIIFPTVDDKPVGFSKWWLQDYLRQTLNFDGVIFSDDLTMEGATVVGNMGDRARLALEAGCDMILICNNPSQAITVLDYLPTILELKENPRLSRMRGVPQLSYEIMQENPNWQYARDRLLNVMAV